MVKKRWLGQIWRERQYGCADWLLGCPIFADSETAEQLAFGHDISMADAESLVAARNATKLDGDTLTVPAHQYLLEGMHGDALRLADMSAKEYVEDRLSAGDTHAQAQCRANAAVRAAQAFADKLEALLPPAQP